MVEKQMLLVILLSFILFFSFSKWILVWCDTGSAEKLSEEERSSFQSALLVVRDFYKCPTKEKWMQIHYYYNVIYKVWGFKFKLFLLHLHYRYQLGLPESIFYRAVFYITYIRLFLDTMSPLTTTDTHILLLAHAATGLPVFRNRVTNFKQLYSEFFNKH